MRLGDRVRLNEFGRTIADRETDATWATLLHVPGTIVKGGGLHALQGLVWIVQFDGHVDVKNVWDQYLEPADPEGVIERSCSVCGKMNDIGKTCWWCGA